MGIATREREYVGRGGFRGCLKTPLQPKKEDKEKREREKKKKKIGKRGGDGGRRSVL